MRRVRLALLAPLTALAFAACDSDHSTGIIGRDSVTTPNPPPANTVFAENFRFRPATLTITAGQSITWINMGAAVHDVTADDGSFASGSLAASTSGFPGGSFVKTFDQAGTFTYHCALHPQMTGTVVVQ